MWYAVITISVICVGVFLWINKKSSGRKAEGRHDKSTFRTEEDLEEYGKPLKDRDSTSPPDFEDAP